MKKFIRRFELVNYRQPTDEEIAEGMNWALEKVLTHKRLDVSVSSLDVPISSDDKESSTFADMMPSTTPSTDVLAQSNHDQKVLESAIHKALRNPVEAELFIAYAKGNTREFYNILQKYGIPEARVRTVIENIKKKLAKNEGIRKYNDDYYRYA